MEGRKERGSVLKDRRGRAEGEGYIKEQKGVGRNI